MCRFCLVSAWCLLFCSGVLRAQALLRMPFGLKWGDTQETMISWAAKQSLDLNNTLPAGKPAMRILRAKAAGGSALPESKATALECHFLHGRLFEVTEHYAPGAELPTELFRAQFERTKKGLIQEDGPRLTNRQERKVADDFVTKTRSFHREPVKGLLLLVVFTEVEQTHTHACALEWRLPVKGQLPAGRR